MARIIPIPIGPIYPGGPCRGIIHVIQKGDTLYQLGKRYHVSVAQLMFANPFVDVYNLQIGDELCIPATIQPRDMGAEERQQYQYQNVPERRGDSDDWDDADEYDDRDDWDDRGGYDDRDDWDEQKNWENRNTRMGQEDWESPRNQNTSENWGDWQDREDWNHKDNSQEWDE